MKHRDLYISDTNYTRVRDKMNQTWAREVIIASQKHPHQEAIQPVPARWAGSCASRVIARHGAFCRFAQSLVHTTYGFAIWRFRLRCGACKCNSTKYSFQASSILIPAPLAWQTVTATATMRQPRRRQRSTEGRMAGNKLHVWNVGIAQS